MTIQHPIEDEVTQLAKRVEKARGRLAYQFDPALTEALSEDELQAERELAERIRGQDRGQRWKEAQAAASAADRARQTTEAIEKADMRDLLMARKAIASQRRESSPHAKLASLYRHRAWSLRALAGVVGAGMLWSAVNVQQNIAPGGADDPLFWFSYLLEGMISVCLIIIMIGTNKVAEWGIVDNRKQVVAAEVALLSLTVTLNTYPYVRAEQWYDAGVHAVAPVMIGVALLIHDAASARYGLAIHRATEQVRDLPDPAEQIRRTLPPIASYRMDRRTSDVMAASAIAELTVEPEPDPIAELGAGPSTAVVDPEIDVVVQDEAAAAEKKPAATGSAFRSVPAFEASSTYEKLAALDKLVEADSGAFPAKPESARPAGDSELRPATNGATVETAATANAEANTAELPAAKSKPAAATEKRAADPKPAAATAKNGAAKPATAEVTPAKPAPAVTKPASAAQSASATTAAIKRQETEKPGGATDAKDGLPTPEIHDTGQFRIAEILEQELAELQAARRRARTNRKTSPAAGRDR
ncbi:hypothetical protein F5X71_13085 [Nocardia brasiliensis]|uniref:DUF2637 domain-containing protein n=1 Tax=Nocardia brasiliensis TaxID=37326 RepID=A0A6G9XQD1_NOCBR|nr:hypothetical protein [Nocardia brasiliensis]QIS03119.1 hypothetical protein F5X71_13085 [Nocardia brasiliensis]